jgi:hypothetical protein
MPIRVSAPLNCSLRDAYEKLPSPRSHEPTSGTAARRAITGAVPVPLASNCIAPTDADISGLDICASSEIAEMRNRVDAHKSVRLNVLFIVMLRGERGGYPRAKREPCDTLDATCPSEKGVKSVFEERMTPVGDGECLWSETWYKPDSSPVRSIHQNTGTSKFLTLQCKGSNTLRIRSNAVSADETTG